MQDSTTANLIFGIDEMISYASQTSTLEAGDLILTGTPAGVGVFRDPPRLLQPGDEITIEIDGVGSHHEPCRRRRGGLTAAQTMIDGRRGPPMSAISRTVLREQVKDILLQRIVSGELRPGERLVETRIASELGTSQAPVREALRDLELLRLVESEPFRGARVREFGDDELIEVYPVRAVLEELAAKEAATRLDGDVSLLEREVDEMRAAASRGDVNALARHDIAFHRLMVEAAGNVILEQCWKSLGVEGRITISLYGTYVEPEEAAELHVPILEAIRSGKPGAAGRAARKHVEAFARIARTRARAATR